MIRTAVALCLMFTPANAADGWTAIDAATVRAPDGRLMRIAGIDAPGAPPLAQCPAEAFTAASARSYLSGALISARKVVAIDQGKDEEGRATAIIQIDGRDLAELMLKAKLARPLLPGMRAWWC